MIIQNCESLHVLELYKISAWGLICGLGSPEVEDNILLRWEFYLKYSKVIKTKLTSNRIVGFIIYRYSLPAK